VSPCICSLPYHYSFQTYELKVKFCSDVIVKIVIDAASSMKVVDL